MIILSYKVKKKRKKYIKIAVEVVAFILFIAVLGYGLQYVDNKTEKANATSVMVSLLN